MSNLNGTSADGKTGLSAVKTGDRTGMPATYGVLAAALAALFGIGISRKRRREEETE